jgi:hypothetical protein
MPRTSHADAQVELDIPPIEFRTAELDGYTVAFGTYREDADPRPFFKGLPDDRCQCPHWGYVLKGKITFHFADHDETYHEGDAYYVPPGHTPESFADSATVDFSPTDLLRQTTDVTKKNMEAMGPPA